MPDCPSVEHLSLAPCKSSPDEVQSKTTPVSFPSHNQNRLDSSGPPPPRKGSPIPNLYRKPCGLRIVEPHPRWSLMRLTFVCKIAFKYSSRCVSAHILDAEILLGRHF